VTNYSNTGLTPAHTYYYRVSALNAVGESATSSNSVATTADVVPVAPSGLSANALSATQISLSWSDNANNETGFRVYISTDATNFSLLATVGQNVATYSSTNLNPATTCYYHVTAFNAVGESAPANASATTADVVPAAPSFLSATTISATQINLSWSDNANNESGFNVYISTDGTTFGLSATLGANVTTYSSTGLNPATTYYYRVTAFNGEGESASPSTASAATPNVPPLAPSGLSASAVSSNLVTLNWTDNANNESGFLIERSSDGINFTQIGTVGAGITTYANSGLAAATTYYYRVRATNSAGNSAYSNIASATTGAAAPPTAPSSLTLTVVSASQIDLHWNDNSLNETQFLIERSPNGTSFTQLATVGANVQSYSATGLQSNTRYYFRVRAMNSAGNSAYSNTANAKTTSH
jgi:fibronectin type 3 domain-containing protein